MVEKYEKIISQKVGFPVKIDGFNFKTNPNLSFVISIKNLTSNNGEISFNNLEYCSKILSYKPKKLDVEKFYLDIPKSGKLFKLDESKKKSGFDISAIPFPVINIDKIYIKIDDKTYFEAVDVISWKKGLAVHSKFLLKLYSQNFEAPIFVGKSGEIFYDRKLHFDNLSVDIQDSKLYIDGSFDKLKLSGKGLPIKTLEQAFLYYYKLRHPKKRNFIENFKNFKGSLDVDLVFSKKGFEGNCYTKNLGADFSKFNIPISLPKVKFIFNERKITAKAEGTFGGEPVYTDVVINDVATDKLHTAGSVKAKLTNKFTQKYFKPITIIGFADAVVRYDVQAGNVNVDYSVGFDQGNDIVVSKRNLDNTEYYRKIKAHTVKKGDKIFLKKYSYLISETDSLKEVFTGEGLFDKIDGHYKPVELSLKTNGDISIKIIKPLIEHYLDTGIFNADVKYNFINKKLFGNITLLDVKRNDFLYLNNININVKDDRVKVISDGTFFNSPISFVVSLLNNFSKGFVIEDIYIHLKNYYPHRGNIATVKTEIDSKKEQYSSLKPKKQTSDYNIEVKQGKIVVDNIIHSKFQLHNVAIYGKLKDNIVEFILPETEYAKGLLSAVGQYDVVKHSSDIYFLASDIDSNEVATNFFRLPNQFEGLAYATLHFISKNKLNDISGSATFAISDGFLPKLGSTEFVFHKSHKLKKLLFFINKPIKFTLSKICNIDFSKPNVFYSNLRGSFKVHDEKVSDVKIFSQSDYLSLFIEGDYNIDNQIASLVVWGRHNRVAEKKIKIFKIPLSFIYKLIFRVEKTMDINAEKVKHIPPIKSLPHEESIFRVKVDGNLNSNDMKMDFKDIRKKKK